jgi:hypothetical protein
VRQERGRLLERLEMTILVEQHGKTVDEHRNAKGSGRSRARRFAAGLEGNV